MKVQRRISGVVLLIHNLGARRGWAVNSTSRPLFSREGPRGRCTGDLVSLGAGMEGYGKSRPHRVLKSFQAVASTYTDCSVPRWLIVKGKGTAIPIQDWTGP